MKYFLPILFFIAMLSCSAKKNTSGQADKIDATISMDKSPCYGRCPVYSIVINGDGKTIYTGKRFVEKAGKYEKQFPMEEVKALVKAFEDARFFEMQDEYTANVSDMATTYVTLTLKGKTKKVKDYYQAPEALKQLEAMIEKMAFSEGWKKTEEGQ